MKQILMILQILKLTIINSMIIIKKNNDEKQNNYKRFWLLIGLGTVWSVIEYIFCCRYCHLKLFNNQQQSIINNIFHFTIF